MKLVENLTLNTNTKMKRLLIVILILSLGSCTLEEFEFKKPSPQAIKATKVTSKSFMANWTPVVGVNKYLLDVAEDPNFTNYIFGYKSIEVEGESIMIDDLKPNKEYYYRVRSQNKSGISQYSNMILVSTTLLATPKLSVLNVTETSFQISWEAIEAAEQYSLEIATDETFQTYFQGYQNKGIKEKTNIQITGTEAGQEYYVRLRAMNGTLRSTYSEVIRVMANNLQIPVVSVPSKMRAIYFQAEWEAVTGADSYLLEVATDADFQFPLAGYESIETSTTSYRVNGLDVFTNYYYRVRAKNTLTTTDASKAVYVESALPVSCKLKIAEYNTLYGIIRFEYDKIDKLSSFVFNDYLGEIREYDINENITRMDMFRYDFTNEQWVFSDYWYFDYDAENRLSRIDITAEGITSRILEIRYSNDQVSRVDEYIYDTSTAVLQNQRSYNYEYDEIGNVIKMNNTTGLLTMEYDDEVNPLVIYDRNLALILNFNGEDQRAFISRNNVVKETNGFLTNVFGYRYNDKGFPVEGELNYSNTSGDASAYPVKFGYEGCFD